MNITIRTKIIILMIVAASSIFYIGYTGYESSRSALFNFKLTADEKIPSITAIMNYLTRFVGLGNKTNEIVGFYGDTSKLEAQFNEAKKDFIASYEALRKLEFTGKTKELIEAAGQKNIDILKYADAMVEKHKLRKKFVTKENGILTPVNAFLTAREFDHVTWTDQLGKDISAGEEFRGQADHALCMFGKWMENERSDDLELNDILDKFKEPHKKIHETAAKINAAMKDANGIAAAGVIFDSETKPLLKQISHIFDECRFYTITKYLETNTVIEQNHDKLSKLDGKLRIELEKINEVINNEISDFVGRSSINIDSSSSLIFITGAAALLILLTLGYAIGKSITGVNKFIIEESRKLTKAVLNGNLDVRGDVQKTNFEFRGIIEGMNDIMNSLIKPLNVTAEYVDRISKGDIPPRITDTYYGDFNEMKNNLNQCIDAVNALIEDANMLSCAAIEGKLAARADTSRHNGDFKKIIAGVNSTLDAIIIPLNTAANYIERISKVDIPPVITENYKGDFNNIKNNLNQCVGSLTLLMTDMEALSQKALEGDLSYRIDIRRHEKGFKKIVAGVTSILDSVVEPIRETSNCLLEMSKGNLDIAVSGNYKGDHAILKNSLNTTVDSMNDILSRVLVAVEQVNTGARQVSDASRSLSETATESASSLEEIGASMQQISSQAGHNAENAAQANGIAVSARSSAGEGNNKMGDLQKAMSAINESALNVGKIIKTIDEIAFQTNLLALNASVEAARAGKHGKGFTVVAQEVRNLAQRSAKAAKETAEMIESSIKKTDAGSKIADETAVSLVEIMNGVAKVTDLVGEIASASKEQEQGVFQVNAGISQVDRVTQQNTATAEESAAASEELSAQAAELKGMLEKFRLKSFGCEKLTDAYVQSVFTQRQSIDVVK